MGVRFTPDRLDPTLFAGQGPVGPPPPQNDEDDETPPDEAVQNAQAPQGPGAPNPTGGPAGLGATEPGDDEDEPGLRPGQTLPDGTTVPGANLDILA